MKGIKIHCTLLLSLHGIYNLKEMMYENTISYCIVTDNLFVF